MSDFLVVDSSAILTLCFEDEDNRYGQQILNAIEDGAGIRVPAVWPLEVGNGLLMAERRGRLKQRDLERFLFLIDKLSISLDERSTAYTLAVIVPLARKHRLTAYDAAYLELAIREKLPLASLDETLVSACKAAGGEVF